MLGTPRYGIWLMMSDSEDFDNLIDKAQSLLDAQEEPDEFVASIMQQLQRRKKNQTVCKGCIKQVKFLIEKLETGSFPWEKDIDKLHKEISKVSSKIEKIREKHEKGK